MKKITSKYTIALFLLLLIFLLIMQMLKGQIFEQKYEVKDGKVVLLDFLYRQKQIIDLTVKEDIYTIAFNAYDAIVTPDGKQLWISANAPEKQYHTIIKNNEKHVHILSTSDQIIIVDTKTNKIQKRINMGSQLGLTDLLITKDSETLYIAAEKRNSLYKMNTKTYQVDLIQLQPHTNPHLLSLSNDNKKVYVTNQAGNKIFSVSRSTNEVKNITNTDEANHIRFVQN